MSYQTVHHSQGVPVPAPRIALLPFSLIDARKAPVLRQVLSVLVHALDDLVAFAAVARVVLALEEDPVCDGADQGDADVHEDDAVSEGVPRFVLAAVLAKTKQKPHAAVSGAEQGGEGRWKRVRTTFELTAPLMLPKLITIASVTLRL